MRLAEGAGGPVVAAVVVLAALAVLLAVRIRTDRRLLSAAESDRAAVIFHSFLARAPDGRLVQVGPDERCWASVFAPVGPVRDGSVRFWGAALRAVGHGVGTCSYLLCPGCAAGTAGANVIRSAAYEPALVFSRLARDREILVEDGKWQHATEFPAPRSVRALVGDVRGARAEWRSDR